MNCQAFRDAYSDFRDGALDEAMVVACHIHVAECADCRQFDDAIRRGIDALRDLPALHVSGEFDTNLFERLAHEELPGAPAVGDRRTWPGLAGTMLILAAVGVAGWESRGWIRPPGADPRQAAGPAVRRDPFVVRFAGDTSLDYRGRFPVIPVPRDSGFRPTRPAPSFEITVDWVVP
jgi:hypothetical protein